MKLTEEQKKQIDYIENFVCNTIGVKTQQVINKDKRLAVTTARNLIWYILHVDYEYSGNTIAKIYLRQLRTVFHQIADIRYKITNCKFYTDLYEKIKESLTPSK